MSYFNDENDPDYDPDKDPEALQSDDEEMPFTLTSSKSQTYFRLPSSAEISVQIYPPGHTFVENLEYKDVSPTLHMVEYILSIRKSKAQYESFLNDTIWSLFSLLAFDSLATNQATTSTWEANLLLVTAMDV